MRFYFGEFSQKLRQYFFAVVFAIGTNMAALVTLANAAPDLTLIEVTRTINEARAQMLIDPDAARIRALEAHKLALTMGVEKGSGLAIEAEAVQVQALYRLKKIDEAEQLLKHALARAQNTDIPKIVLGDLLISRGKLAMLNGDVKSSLTDFQKAYRLFREVSAPRWQAIALQSLATLYNEGGDSSTALRYYSQAEEIYSGDPLLSLAAHNNIGNAYLSMFRPRDAEAEFRKALTNAQQLNSRIYMYRVKANIAKALIDQGRLGDASAVIDPVLAGPARSDNASELWAFWVARAQIAYRRKDYPGASFAIARALSGVDPVQSSPSFRPAHDTAYSIYRATGRPADALVHLEAMARIDKESAELTASTAAALMAARFDSANQDLKIARLKAEQTEAASRSQRNLFIVASIGAILVLVLLGGSLILITRSRNRERAAKLVLEQTNRELERAMAAKMEFLATTSHEIRTPLNGILGMTQVLLTHRGLDNALRDRIGIVHSAGETMRALVDDILDVAKMETGKLSVESGIAEVRAMLRDVAQMWRLQSETAGIDLVLDLDECPERIVGDSARIRQIVFNLMSNAMKFTESGTVRVSARPALADGVHRLHISVTDSGIGIAPEWHESIFELFQQVDGGTTRKYGGTGLGLAICRNLARAMGGDISVESMPAFGSTFTIDLPLVRCDQDAEPAKSGLKERSILVIERNPMTRGVLRAILGNRFESIDFVSSAAEAHDLIRGQSFEWLFIDAVSLDDDPQGLAAEVEALGERGGASILLVRAAGDESEVPLAADVVLTKPLTKSAIVNAIGGDWVNAGPAKPALLAAAS